MLKQLSKESVDPETKLAYVLPTMQLGVPNIAGSSVETISESVEKTSLQPSETAVDEYFENTTPSSSASPSEFDPVEDEQVSEPELEQTPFPNIFVVGDAADAFGAINAGHNAYFQAEVAARNVLLLTEALSKDKSGKGAEEEDVRLIRYKPGPPGIKVSLGLVSRPFSFTIAYSWLLSYHSYYRIVTPSMKSTELSERRIRQSRMTSMQVISGRTSACHVLRTSRCMSDREALGSAILG